MYLPINTAAWYRYINVIESYSSVIV